MKRSQGAFGGDVEQQKHIFQYATIITAIIDLSIILATSICDEPALLKFSMPEKSTSLSRTKLAISRKAIGDCRCTIYFSRDRL